MPSALVAASLVVMLSLEPTAAPVDAPEAAPSFLVPEMPDPDDPAWTAPLPPPPPPPEPTPTSEPTRSPAPAATSGAASAPTSAARSTASSTPPASPSPPATSASRRVDRRTLVTAGLVTSGLGLALGVVALRADRRVDALAGSLRSQEALGVPQSEIDRLEQDLRRQRITVVTAAVGAGVLGVTGITLLAVALFRRGSPSLTHRSPRLRLSPTFVFAF